MGELVKNLPAMQETWVRSLGCEDPPGEGNSYPLQYSGLENSMGCIVHGVSKEWDMTERLSLCILSSWRVLELCETETTILLINSYVFSFLRNKIIELNGLKKMELSRMDQKEKNINEALL